MGLIQSGENWSYEATKKSGDAYEIVLPQILKTLGKSSLRMAAKVVLLQPPFVVGETLDH